MALVRSWLASMSAFLVLNFLLSLFLPRSFEYLYLMCPFVAGVVAAVVYLYSSEAFHLGFLALAVFGGVLLLAVYYNFIVLFNLHRPFWVGIWGVALNIVAASIGSAVAVGGWKFILQKDTH